MAIDSSRDCPHVPGDEGRCALCGACLHEMILNGACIECGERGIVKTIKPAREIVSADRLRSRKR